MFVNRSDGYSELQCSQFEGRRTETLGIHDRKPIIVYFFVKVFLLLNMWCCTHETLNLFKYKRCFHEVEIEMMNYNNYMIIYFAFLFSPLVGWWCLFQKTEWRRWTKTYTLPVLNFFFNLNVHGYGQTVLEKHKTLLREKSEEECLRVRGQRIYIIWTNENVVK